MLRLFVPHEFDMIVSKAGIIGQFHAQITFLYMKILFRYRLNLAMKSTSTPEWKEGEMEKGRKFSLWVAGDSHDRNYEKLLTMVISSSERSASSI